MSTKTVIDNAVLRGSQHDQYLQRVATVYSDGQEYRVFAPSKATGLALDWAEHFSVREPSSSSLGFGAEVPVDDELKRVLIQATVDELKRHAVESEIWGSGGNLQDGNFYPAQICLHGHVINADGHLVLTSGIRKNEHCQECGSRCIHRCEHGDAPIRGKQTMSHGDYVRPSFCYKCAKPYPWMAERLETARELLWNDDKLSIEERESLWGLLQYVMSDPKSDLVPARRKLIDIKLGGAVAATREFILDFLAKFSAEMSRP
jgi:hypothetical protein